MKQPHEHCWNYVHAVYSGPRGGSCVRRWCRCGREQVGTVERWRTIKAGEFDESAVAASRAEKEPKA